MNYPGISPNREAARLGMLHHKPYFVVFLNTDSDEPEVIWADLFTKANGYSLGVQGKSEIVFAFWPPCYWLGR